MQRPLVDESHPQVTKTKEHHVPRLDLVTDQADKTRSVITLEEQQDLIKLVLGMNFEGADMNSSQDFEGFMGLQVPSDNL